MLFALVVAALESRDEHCDARADAGLEVAALETRDELCEAGLLRYAALPQLEIGGVGITAHSASARASRTSFQGRAVKGFDIDSGVQRVKHAGRKKMPNKSNHCNLPGPKLSTWPKCPHNLQPPNGRGSATRKTLKGHG